MINKKEKINTVSKISDGMSNPLKQNLIRFGAGVLLLGVFFFCSSLSINIKPVFAASGDKIWRTLTSTSGADFNLLFTYGDVTRLTILGANGGIDLANHTIINVAAPINPTDAATKGYIDNKTLSCIVVTGAQASPQHDGVASCSTGYQLTGGGCKVGDSGDYSQTLEASYPSGLSWHCLSFNYVTPYATCCKII